ncbi:MAG: hypothetical protein ACK4IU_00210 [Tabrizicola flagellatus]|uniref:hypothetical protein n=1 Tax=Tabrizicola flagellatus TaxID=2593021 RepID=UPI00391CF046
MRGIGAVFLLAVSAGAVAAGPFDGVYRPDGADSWDCRTVGSDGGALMIRDGQFHGVESLCRLTNPVEVRGMSAVLYDAECDGEGESYSYRMMLMRVPEGLAMVQDGHVSLLERCE